MTFRHGNIIFALSLLLLGMFIFLVCPASDFGIAQEEVIYFEYASVTAQYGEVFWSNAEVRADGRLQFKGKINGGNFSIDNTAGTMFLVYEPHGRISSNAPMVKLTNADGNIIAPPGKYELSVSPTSYPTNNHACIMDAEDNVIYTKVCFNNEYTYTIQKRQINITVDESEELLRFYGGEEVALDYTFSVGSKSMVNGDALYVVLTSTGNNTGADVGLYDIELNECEVFNEGVTKTTYYNIIYDNSPKLRVEKYKIIAQGVDNFVDYYRHDGDYSGVFEEIFEEIEGINGETVRIFYTLDEENIERVNGLLAVNLVGYPTTSDTARLKVYDAVGNFVDSADNYDINLDNNNTRLIITKRDITLYTHLEFEDEEGIYLDNDCLRETYGFVATQQFERTINILGEDINFMLSLPYAAPTPIAGEHIVILMSANNEFYNITIHNTVRFIIDKYVVLLVDYLETAEEGAVFEVNYGIGLPEYSNTLVVDSVHEVNYTLYSEVNETSHPGEYGFVGYEEEQNFILDYSNIIIRVLKQELSLKVTMASPNGIAYGDEYSIGFEGLVAEYPVQITTQYSKGDRLIVASAVEGKPYLAGAYTVRVSINTEALDFYTIGEQDYFDFALNIARRNIVVKFVLNTSTKEYNSLLDLSQLGYLVNHHESDTSLPGLVGEDKLTDNGTITCAGLAKTATVGEYVVNTSKLGNENYNIMGGSVKVFFNEVETINLKVTKLKQANLPEFAPDITSFGADSVTLSNIQINGTNVGSFAISKDGGNTYSSYQTSNVFGSLSEGKKYYFKVRIKGDNNIEQGLESVAVSKTTTLNTPNVKSSAYTIESITLELTKKKANDVTYNYLYQLGNGAWTENSTFEGLNSGTRYQVKYKCVSPDTESKVGSIYLWTANKAPEIEEDVGFSVLPNRIHFEGFTENYEYRIAVNQENQEELEFSPWSTVFDFQGLSDSTEYLLQIRVKASPTTGDISGEVFDMFLTTPELIIEKEPLVYEGIMEYVAKYFLVGISGFMLVLMISFIVGFIARFKVV